MSLAFGQGAFVTAARLTPWPSIHLRSFCNPLTGSNFSDANLFVQSIRIQTLAPENWIVTSREIIKKNYGDSDGFSFYIVSITTV